MEKATPPWIQDKTHGVKLVYWCNSLALNLKNPEVERLAAEVAALAHETKTEAIRKALLDRKARLTGVPSAGTRTQRAVSVLTSFRAALPAQYRGRPLTREEEDDILGFGPGGV
jgi:antitoxin VapB